jgi:transcriptional regulator with XRE-family HTH domain
MYDKKLIGLNVRQLRKLRKLTLEDVALSINTSKGTLSNIELGKKPVSLDMAIALAEYFNVSLDLLLSDWEADNWKGGQAADMDGLPADIAYEDGIMLMDKMVVADLIDSLDEESFTELKRYLAYLNIRRYLNWDKGKAYFTWDLKNRARHGQR